jgi:hypothetical protein
MSPAQTETFPHRQETSCFYISTFDNLAVWNFPVMRRECSSPIKHEINNRGLFTG